jgi:cathepsin B
MKTVFAVASLIGAVQAGWKNPVDDAHRKEIIATVNSDRTSTWRAGMNPRFEGTSFEYVKSLLGSLENEKPLHEKLPIVNHPVGATANPTAFDWRTQQIAQLCPSLGEVRDQSNCGSCWAFGAVEAMTDRICIQSKGATYLHISAEDMLSCCNTCGSGCNGGYPSSAWTYGVHTGVVTGGNYQNYSWCYAYALPTCDHHTTGQYVPCTSLPTYPTPMCHTSCDSNADYNTAYAQDKRKFKNSYGVGSSVASIQTEIMTNGPVEASFTVYEDFESYTGGVYIHKTGQALGGHAVKILGWGVDGSTPYWTVANSWNEDWGEKGFFRIISGVNECGIEGSIVAGNWA